MKLLYIIIVALIATQASGQSVIISDGAIGAEAGEIRSVGGEIRIETSTGQSVGENLFHSFSRFHVGASDTARFATNADTGRIIARVTDVEGATLDGVIATDTFRPVDLWMLSPGGISIGPEGRIAMGGAVHLSAGDSLTFDDGSTFRGLANGPLTLSAAAPQFFGFLNAKPGKIRFSGSDLTLRSDVSISGGSIILDDATIRPGIGARMLIAATAQGETVGLGERSVSALETQSPARGGVVRIRARAAFDEFPKGVISPGGGSVVVEAGQLLIDGGAIVMNSAQETGINDGVRIEAQQIDLVNDGAIRTRTFGEANAGAISVVGFDSMTIQRGPRGQTVELGETVIESETVARGAAGDVLIAGDRLVLADRGLVFSNTSGAGAAGNMLVKVGSAILSGGAQIGSAVLDAPNRPRATGVGGVIDVDVAGTLQIRGKSVDLSSVTGEASPSGFFASTVGVDGGVAGSIIVKANRLLMSDGGHIASETFNGSDSGRVDVLANTLKASSAAEITTRVVARIDQETPVLGDAGSILVRSSGKIDITSGAIISSDAGAAPPGDLSLAGTVRLDAPMIIVSKTGAISTNSAAGDGGDIDINASGLFLVDGGSVTSLTTGAGDGGSILISVGLGAATGVGQIRALTTDLVNGDPSRLTFRSPVFLSDATSATVIGDVTIPPEIFEAEGNEREPPPLEFFDAFAFFGDRCAAAAVNRSAFIVERAGMGFGGTAQPTLFGVLIDLPPQFSGFDDGERAEDLSSASLGC